MIQIMPSQRHGDVSDNDDKYGGLEFSSAYEAKRRHVFDASSAAAKATKATVASPR